MAWPLGAPCPTSGATPTGHAGAVAGHGSSPPNCLDPRELRNLLLETNGAEIAYGLDLIWSAEAILQRNLLIYGFGGIVIPFIGIKLIDLLITGLKLI